MTAATSTGLTLAGRPWDAFDAYLFDIDGTLINCTDAVHYFAFCAALKAVAGRDLTLEGVVTQGNVDNGILRDALRLAELPEELWCARLPELQTIMCDHVAQHSHHLETTVLPGVREVLIYLKRRRVRMGVATGNLQRIGEAKLTHAELLTYFTHNGWSDAYETRVEVFHNALNIVRVGLPPGAAVCVIGDTPADIRAARANHIAVIAVATGIYSRADLEAEQPDLCLDSLVQLLHSPA